MDETQQPEQPAELAPQDDLTALLQEFDNANPPQPEPAADQAAADGVPTDELQQMLDSLGPDPKVAELEGLLGQRDGEISALRQAEFERNEQAAYDTFVDAIKQQIPDNGLPDDWVSDKLMAMAARDPNLLAAWEYRSADRAAVDQRLRQVEEAINFLQRNPAQADPQKLRALQEHGHRLGLALNAQAILSKAERAVIKEAKGWKPIDADATADRNMVAQSVRDAGVGYAAPPPPRLGQMTDQEFRKHIKDNYGLAGF